MPQSSKKLSVPSPPSVSRNRTNPPAPRLDLDAVLKIVSRLTPLQIEALKPQLFSLTPQELTLNTPCEAHLKDALNGLLWGPRDFDAFLLHHALSSPATSKFSSAFKYIWILSLVLLNRRDGDIDAIQNSFRRMYGDTLLTRLREALRKDDLFQTLFTTVLENRCDPGLSEVLEPERPALQTAIDKEADELFTATVGSVEPAKFAWIFAKASSVRLADVATAYNVKRGHTLVSAVEKKLKKTEAFRDELLYMLRGVAGDQEVANRDAELLENTMKGFGKRDFLGGWGCGG